MFFQNLSYSLNVEKIYFQKSYRLLCINTNKTLICKMYSFIRFCSIRLLFSAIGNLLKISVFFPFNDWILSYNIYSERWHYCTFYLLWHRGGRQPVVSAGGGCYFSGLRHAGRRSLHGGILSGIVSSRAPQASGHPSLQEHSPACRR